MVEWKRKKKGTLVSGGDGHVGSGVGRRSQTHPAYLPKMEEVNSVTDRYVKV